MNLLKKMKLLTKINRDKKNMKCLNCPRECGVNRKTDKGFCSLSNKIKIAKVSLHFGEEPCISGKNGSGTIFFSGCQLKCVFCQNYNLSHDNFGKEITILRLAQIFKELENKGAHNINLVTPTPYVDKILKALKIYKPKIPIVYNTSGYENVNVLKKLKNYVDIYLVDLKFFDKNLSSKYLKAPNYFEKANEAICEMLLQQPKIVIKNKIMQKGVIIRHLVMPNCVKDSINILEHINKNFKGARVSLMSQYIPLVNLKKYKEIDRKITPLEYKIVLNKAHKLNLKGYMQSLTSATKNEIPNFDLEGV